MIEAIGAISSAEIMPIDRTSVVSRAESTPFADAIKGVAGQLNTDLVNADQAVHDIAAGKEIATHDLMLTLEQAKLSLQVAVEVRNRVVESYQELMRMQI